MYIANSRSTTKYLEGSIINILRQETKVQSYIVLKTREGEKRGEDQRRNKAHMQSLQMLITKFVGI